MLEIVGIFGGCFFFGLVIYEIVKQEHIKGK